MVLRRRETCHVAGRAWGWFGVLAIAGSGSIGLAAAPVAGDPVVRAETALPTVTSPPPSAGRWVTIIGRGFGHGVGMAQDGAYWMGRQGRTSAEILRHFYPGTALGTRGGNVRVPLGGAGVVTLTLSDGGTIAGRAIAPGGTVTVRPADGELVATINPPPDSGADTSAAPALAMVPISFRSQAPTAPGDSSSSIPVITPALEPPATIAPVSPSSVEPSAAAVGVPGIVTDPAPPPPPDPAPVASSSEPPPEPVTPPTPATLGAAEAASAPETPDTVRGNPLVVAATGNGTVTYAGRRYRGAFELLAQGGVRVVNELDVEQYLRGMGEVLDPRWPPAALQAQAIAARTYAFRTMASAGEVCPTQRCQVYVGVRAEYPAMDEAVTTTRGKVVTYAKGKLAITFYSASGGGTIATPAEAFGGSGEFPYLQSGTYPTGDLKSWVVTMPIDEVGRRVGYRGSASHVEVTRVGPSGRAVELTVRGDGAALTIAGPRFDAALGLRSTLFTVQQSDTPTPAGLGDVEVLSATDLTDTSDEQGVEPPVFRQTGFFETPSTLGDNVSGSSDSATRTSSANVPASRQTRVITTEPPSETFSGAIGMASSATPTERVRPVAEQSQLSEVAFVGALTAAGTAIVATTRRWLRKRRS